MILPLYGFLVLISLILIVLGLVRPTESYQAVVGFFFLFLLSMILLNGNVTYETGANIATSLVYNPSGQVTSTTQTVTYSQTAFDDSTSKNIGKYLAVAASIGFAGVLFSLKNNNWGRSNEEE